MLFFASERFLERCKNNLGIGPASKEFEPEFLSVLQQARKISEGSDL
jgi:hypothetical protein